MSKQRARPWRNRVGKLLSLILAPMLALLASQGRAQGMDWDFAARHKAACSSGSMREMNECLALAYLESDKQLNKIYHRLRGELLNPEALARAQLAWVRFRDLHCEFHVPKDSVGSDVPYSRNSCLIDLTEKRILDLKQIVPCNGCVEFKPQYYQHR